jgi:DNA mismatch repair protein MutS2
MVSATMAAPEVLRRLEWQAVRDQLRAHARTPMGQESAEALVPGGAGDEILRRHARADEMRRVHASLGRLPITELKHPRPVLAALQVSGRTLAGEDIYETVRLLVVARELGGALRELDPEDFPQLGAEWARLPDLEGIIGPIEGNVTASGQLDDRASPELARIRREIRQLSERLTETLEGILRAEWTGPVLRDRFITVRNDRYVVPVRTDAPRRFHGIVHGTSSTEKTLFVEPIETVEINNRLVGLREEEKEETERILAEYTGLLRAAREEIETTARVLGEIDLLEAIAAWAELEGAVRPDLVEGGGFRLRAARHPVLEATLAGTGRSMVPLDVDLPRELRVLVISGPNAGGKTVALKTVGLLTLMAHAGLPLPAEQAQVPLLGAIFADIGDEQSISGSLSTFASHVSNLAWMIDRARPPALALADEIGTGTDPAEGAALGAAVLERLRQAGLHVVATTHHTAIKTWAYQSEAAINAAFEFDERTMRPTYRLVSGVAGSSVGLTMAEQLGLERAVVEDARRRLDPSGAEAAHALDSIRALAGELERQRAELTEERRRLRDEEERRRVATAREEERRKAEWERRVDDLVSEFHTDARRLIQRLENERLRRKLDVQRARQERELRERYSEEARAARRTASVPSDWQPAAGERVVVSSFDREGEVRSVSGRRAEVKLGLSVFTVPVDDLRPVADAPPERPAPAAGRRRPALPGGVSAEITDREVPRELNLLGQRVEEALAALDKYLDDCVLARLDEVRVVHGFGTGRLKAAVRDHLDRHGAVESWRDAAPEEGGGGATVARLDTA